MPLFAVFAWLFLSLSDGYQEVELIAPDSVVAQKFVWAKDALERDLACHDAASCDDVAMNTLALSSIGRFEIVRSALTRVQHRSPLWLVAAYQYWLASTDDAFLREQWWSIQNLLYAPPQVRPLGDGGVLLAATDALLALARAMNDSTARVRARSIYATAEQRAQEHPGVIAPAFGLLNAELADAHMIRLVDTVHARFPIASGLIALGLYEYHRDTAAFSLVRRMATQAQPAPAMFVLPLVRGLLGWEVDARHRALALEPHLPARWNRVTFNNLGFGDEHLNVAIRRAQGTYEIQVTRARRGPPITLQLSPAFPRGTQIRGVKVNDEDVATHVETNAQDMHVVIDASLRQEVNVEIEYAAPQRRASLR